MGVQWQQEASGSQPGAPGPSHHYDPLSEMRGMPRRRRRRYLGDMGAAPNAGFFHGLGDNLRTKARGMKEEIAKKWTSIITRLQSLHTSSDARRPSILTIPMDLADRPSDPLFTSISDQEADEYERVSQPEDPQFCQDREAGRTSTELRSKGCSFNALK